MIVILLLFLASVGSALKDGEMELLLVQVLWRHGDRAPTLTFQNDPFKESNWTFGGGGFGQLSPKGMQQHFDFGKQLKDRYIKSGFLGERYSSKEDDLIYQEYSAYRSPPAEDMTLNLQLTVSTSNFHSGVPSEQQPGE